MSEIQTIDQIVSNDEQYLQMCRMSLASRIALETTIPFYSPMSKDGNWKSLSVADILSGIKNGSIDLEQMMDGQSQIELRGARVKVVDEYRDEDMRILRLDVKNGNVQEHWMISSEDFSMEYQTMMAIADLDEKHYAELQQNPDGYRTMHNALMDLLDRRTVGADPVTMRALERLRLLPETNDEQAITSLVSHMKDAMIEFCKEWHIEIDAANTMSLEDMKDLQDVGRDILRSRGQDMMFNNKMAEVKQAKEELEQSKEIAHDR